MRDPVVVAYLLVILWISVATAANPVSHIVVLMMENRSFDHLLGWLKAALVPGIEGLTSGMTTPRYCMNNMLL